MNPKSLPKSFLTLFALTLVLFGNVKQAEAYDFYAVCSTGQTLFYNITDATNHYVEMTYPGNSSNYWGGYTQPTGDIILPSTVTYGGNNYTVTAIGDNVFIFCNGLTGSLTIPNSITSIGNNAFNSCYGFTGSLTIPNSVISIGENAFTSCTHFSGSLTIPNSVTSIGDRAFSHCSGFTGSLTISNSVTSIGEGVFSQCSGLSGSLTIPNSVTSIGGSAFYGCSGFTGTLTIPNSVTTIGQYAFYQCSGFTGTLTIPNSVTSIGEWAFSHCSGFTGALILPNSLTSISMRAFSTCSGLTGSLIIPNSVTSIDYEAFHNCSGFTGSLTIGSSVTSIGDAVFENCTGFTSVTALPETPPTLGTNVFSLPTTIPVYVPCGKVSAYQSVTTWNAFTNIQEYCDPLIYSINPDGVSVTVTGHVDGTAATGSLTIPETKTIDGVAYTVTKIGSNAFNGCTGLTGSLTIPNSVTEIQTGAFQNCSGFTGSLTILNSVTFIGIYAFCNCTGFTGTLNIPNSVTFIGNNAFQNCSGFTGSLTIPNSVTNIGGMAFQNCTGFTGSLTIGTGVTAIAGSAFKNCTGFTQVNYNAANCADRTDGQKPFEGCTNATTLIIGNTVQRIPAWIFYECSNFTGTLTIPSSVTEIGNGAFCGCTGFTGTLTIPNSVTIIDNNAFNGCTGLTGSLTIPNSVTSIGGGAFSSCNGFNGTLTIGNSVESIGIQAFMDCAGFTGSLTLPNSVTEIGYNAFIRCSGFNGSLTIGNSLTSISHRAFKDCSGFTSITALPETPPTLGSEVFSLPTTIPVYAPCESMAAYQSALGWSGFTNYFGTCDVIIFADAHVKAICVQNWDTNGDGELSYNEAAAVTTFNPENYGNTSKFYGTDITSFDEMQYFTGLTSTQGAFYNCTHLASVTLPSHLTTIDESAFNGCSSLASIVLSDGVTSISHSVFNGCTSLTSIVLPSGVTSIGMRAFYGCTGLTSITLPSGVNSILNQAFYNCTGLTSLTVEAITPPTAGSQAFFFVPTTIPVHVPCSSIEAYQAASQWSSFTNYIGENCIIVFADEVVRNVCVANFDTNHDGALSYDEAAAVTTLTPSGNAIFYSNHAITTFDELQYFTGLTSIGAYAFNGCTNLTSITLPNQITYIDNMAFKNCSSLTSLTIPNNVTSLGVTPFMGCTALEHFAVEGGNNIYSSPNGCNAIIETATNTLIAGCKSTIIPSEVTTIGSGAFDSCTSLTSITIPSGVTSIEGYAFIGCTGLTSITMEGTTPPSVGSAAFQNVSSTIPVYVPCESLDAYQDYNNTGSPWGGFTNIKTLNEHFPWTEDFENYAGLNNNNTNYNTMPSCWSSIHGANPAQNYYDRYPSVYTYSNYAHSGSNFIFFADNYNTDYTHSDQYAILPSVENVNQMTLSLYALKEYRTAYFEVGVMTDPDDASTFTMVGSATATTTHTLYSFSFANYTGTGTYIAIRMPKATNGNNRGVCIDDVTLDHIITFADANVKSICVQNWDTNNDGELSYSEAAIIESLGTVFYNNAAITSFNELQYFTGLTSIGNTAFRNCTGLTSIIIPSGVSTIGVNPFSGCSALASITVTSDNTEYDSRNNCNAIIKTASNTLITGCKNTVIPSDVTSIGMGAFERCTTLTSINLPSTLTSIGEWAFNECNSLTSVAIPSTVSSIMNNAFRNCTGLTSITVEATTPPALGDDVFKNVPTTIPVYVPCGYYAAYNNIGWGGFTNFVDPCGAIDFEDTNVKDICVAHWDSNGDGELSYPEAEAIQSLGTVFNNTTITSFDELQYFTGLTIIGLNAFNGCSNLASITLPSTVTSIGVGAFTGCANMTSISIPNDVTFIGRNTFKDCTSLASVTLPSGITAINEGTFNNCTGLTSVTIQNGVQSIGIEAFKGCANLTSVTLPSSVNSISNYAFQNCTGLIEIHVEATTPPRLLNTTPFNNVPKIIPVYVPCESVEDYQTYNNGNPWGGFTNIIGEGCSQEYTLVDGWNWWAPTVAMSLTELETALNGNAILINSQDGGFLRYENGSWSGTLTEIEVGKMYKIKTEAVCTLSLQGDRPAVVTVTLEPGYTWFGYTGTQATSIATALGTFVPATGDMIIGENGTATYTGGTWTGNLTELVPGHGYVYFSTYNNTRTLILR